eukprot:3600442-Pleurochrysis_carterae.AAC.4
MGRIAHVYSAAIRRFSLIAVSCSPKSKLGHQRAGRRLGSRAGVLLSAFSCLWLRSRCGAATRGAQKPIHERYDLKGSTRNRFTTDAERQAEHTHARARAHAPACAR